MNVKKSSAASSIQEPDGSYSNGESVLPNVAEAEAVPWPAWTCPQHGSPLTQLGRQHICSERHSFLESNGIPRFVPASTYADHFGEQWKRYRLTQLDSYTGHSITRARMRRSFGDALWNRLEGLNVLECGCGAGRFTEILLERKARVTSVDLSDAVDANVLSFPIGPRHRVAQADILALPFAKAAFDVVVCLGVIQHTPDPELTIQRLADNVRPGGWLIIDHYTYDIGWYTKTAPLFRMILKRLPRKISMRFTERLVDLMLPLHKRVAHSRLRSIVYRLSPVLTHYGTYPDLSDELQREWALLDTHDSLTDYFKHFRTRGQILRQLQALGLEEIWCEYGGNGVEARARRRVRDA